MLRYVLFFVVFIGIGLNGWSKPVGIHSENFYCLERDGELFYPIGANVGFLLDTSEPSSRINDTLTRLALSGVNTLRINVDDAMTEAMPVITAPNGEILPEIISRLDDLFQQASQRKMVVVLSFLDLYRMYINWDSHPANSKNGGSCSSPEDYFVNSKQRSRLSKRIHQLVERYRDRDNLIWEIANGVNVDEIEFKQQRELAKNVHLWLAYFIDIVMRTDTNHHLRAVAFAPNSLPYGIMDFQTLNLYFMHIRSKKALLAATAGSELVATARRLRKPVFVAETTWGGSESEREAFIRNMIWSAFATGSGTWLSPVKVNGHWQFSDADLNLLSTLVRFLPMVNLNGKPRPPAEAPIELFPKDSYFLVDHIIGNDWIFWLVRKEPGKSQAKVTFHTVEGWYEFQWFNPDRSQRFENHQRRIPMRMIQMISPEFDETLVGRLRFIKPMEKADLEKLKSAEERIRNITEPISNDSRN